MSEEQVKKEQPVKLDFRNYLNVYEFDTTLPGSGEVVKFRPITTGQLKRLLVYENETDPMVIEGALDELISSSVISEEFNINKLYLQDRFFLLVELRRKSKGDNYKFQYDCPKCNSQTMQVIKLSDLPVKKMPEDIDNVIKIDNNLSVKLSHVTRGMQKNAIKSIKNMKQMNNTQRATEMALATHASAVISIVTPEGEITEPSIEDSRYLLDNISTESYTDIRDWFDKYDFGMDFTFEIKCSSCDKSERVDVPVENFFF